MTADFALSVTSAFMDNTQLQLGGPIDAAEFPSTSTYFEYNRRLQTSDLFFQPNRTATI